jgi:hypothetical protein
MGAPVAMIVIDQSTSRVVQGEYSWDRSNGGILIPPSGASFPDPAEPGEWFWNTSDEKLYRRNDANTAWIAVTGVPQLYREIHVVTAGEASSGYFNAAVTPASPGLVSISVVGGLLQINKWNVGSSGVTPDFDVLNDDEIHINNNGTASGLSGDIDTDDALVLDYPY